MVALVDQVSRKLIFFFGLHNKTLNELKYFTSEELLTYRGDDSALTWPDWYCKVASNIVSAITILSSI